MNWVVGFVPPIDEPRTKSLEGPGPSETLGFVNGSLPRHSSVILIHEWNRVAMRPSPASDSTRRGGGTASGASGRDPRREGRSRPLVLRSPWPRDED